MGDLAVFVRVVEQGTLSAVARERQVAVSQVSRTIERVERACGARLLRRSARGLSLTPDGQVMLEFCRSVSQQRHSLESGRAQGARQLSGRVCLSLSAVMAQHWVVPSLPALLRLHPKLELDLLIDDDVIDLVREGVDIAIRTGEPAAQSVVAHPLGHLQTGLWASSTYLAQHGTPTGLPDLKAHCLLSNVAHPVLNRLAFAQGSRLKAAGALRSSSTAVIAEMAAQGLGIAQLPLQVARRLQLRPVLADEFESAHVDLHAVTLPDRYRLPRVRACVQHLKTLFSD